MELDSTSNPLISNDALDLTVDSWNYNLEPLDGEILPIQINTANDAIIFLLNMILRGVRDRADGSNDVSEIPVIPQGVLRRSLFDLSFSLPLPWGT